MRIKNAINLGITLTLMVILSTLLANPVWAAPNNKIIKHLYNKISKRHNNISKLRCTVDGEIPKFNANLGQWECAADEDNTQAICNLYRLTGNRPPSDCPMGCAEGDRYEDQGDGTVVDCNTNLVWLKDASCVELSGSWIGANAAVAALSNGMCGLTDGSVPGNWRSPDIDEFCSAFAGLQLNCPLGAASDSLINTNFSFPAVSNTAGTGQWSEGDPFTTVRSAYYWSATEDGADGADGAWAVDLSIGEVFANRKANDYMVWPVRGGQ